VLCGIKVTAKGNIPRIDRARVEAIESVAKTESVRAEPAPEITRRYRKVFELKTPEPVILAPSRKERQPRIHKPKVETIGAEKPEPEQLKAKRERVAKVTAHKAEVEPLKPVEPGAVAALPVKPEPERGRAEKQKMERPGAGKPEAEPLESGRPKEGTVEAEKPAVARVKTGEPRVEAVKPARPRAEPVKVEKTKVGPSLPAKPLKIIRRRKQEAPKVLETTARVVPQAMLEGIRINWEEEGEGPSQ